MAKHEDLSQQENNVAPELQDEGTPPTVTTNRIKRAVRLSFFVLMLAAGAGVAYRTLYHTDSPPSSIEVQEEGIPINKDETTASVVVSTPEDSMLKDEVANPEEEAHTTSEPLQENGVFKNDGKIEDDVVAPLTPKTQESITQGEHSEDLETVLAPEVEGGHGPEDDMTKEDLWDQDDMTGEDDPS